MMRRFFVVLILFFMLPDFRSDSHAQNIKEPNVAGQFYSADKEELDFLVGRYLAEAGEAKVEGRPLVLISPHAGYLYSGAVAGHGFAALEGQTFATVIILAPSHFFSYHGAAVYAQGAFRTPLGELEIDQPMARALIACNHKLLFFEPKYFQQEHSLEVQLPFLQKALPKGFKIVPVLLGDISYEDCRLLAGYLAEVIGDTPTLVLASSDLSHYRPHAEAVKYDQKTIAFIKNLDSSGLWEAVADIGWNVCGSKAVVTGLIYAKAAGADRTQILKYANSGDVSGDKTRVVGYTSIIISKSHRDSSPDRKVLTPEDKKRLLEIARVAIAADLTGESAPDFVENSPGLNLKNGVFVTLHNDGSLRGCVGTFFSAQALYQTVAAMAIQAASHDHRFIPLTTPELESINIEISVLTEPQLTDDWRNIRLGIDGVIISRGLSTGVFLPQVAAETRWDLETFLGELCVQKAGIPRESFKNDPTVRIYTFQTGVFSEDDHNK